MGLCVSFKAWLLIKLWWNPINWSTTIQSTLPALYSRCFSSYNKSGTLIGLASALWY